MIGHSAGGGFALRIAAGPLGSQFDRFVLLSPYLGYSRRPTGRRMGRAYGRRPTCRASSRQILLGRIGIDWPQSLPAIAFADVPEAKMSVTNKYSFRLLQNYTAPPDWKGAFERARGRIAVIAGAADELMDAAAYERALPPLGVPVTILPGVNHMGVCYRSEAITAILAGMAK